jgi:thiol-disulfide isomerase/thioredoxin
MFICQHCPYVQHIKQELAKLGKDYASKDIAMVGISANDAEKYPDDAPEELAKFVKEAGITYPLLHDESQDVAKLYTAACTPDIFLFARASSPAGAGRGSMARQTSGGDVAWKLVYRGQLDDSRPGNGKPVTGKDLRAAMDAVLADKPVSKDQRRGRWTAPPAGSATDPVPCG